MATEVIEGAALELYDPREGDVALRVVALPVGFDPAPPRRCNVFTVLWVQEGRGTFCADLGRYEFRDGSLLCAVPYQPFCVQADAPVRGVGIQFHANFLCIETHHAEVGCNGVLFNDTYGLPVVPLDADHGREFHGIVAAMRAELAATGLAHAEVLLSYLKVLLVKAARLKLGQRGGGPDAPDRAPARPPALDALAGLIEKHFRTEHRPAFYARRLHLAPKSLAKLVKAHLGRTPTELIRERVLRQAKWELLHTLKPVKQVAAEVGFADELYFSRVFRRATGCAPTAFRRFETAIRGGANVWVR